MSIQKLIPLDHLAQMMDEAIPLKKRIDLLGEQIEVYKEVVEVLRTKREALIDRLGEE